MLTTFICIAARAQCTVRAFSEWALTEFISWIIAPIIWLGRILRIRARSRLRLLFHAIFITWWGKLTLYQSFVFIYLQPFASRFLRPNQLDYPPRTRPCRQGPYCHILPSHRPDPGRLLDQGHCRSHGLDLRRLWLEFKLDLTLWIDASATFFIAIVAPIVATCRIFIHVLM